MGVDSLFDELAGVDEQSARPCGGVPVVASDMTQASNASMVQSRFAIRMDVDNLCGDVPEDCEQRSFGEGHAVPSESKHSATPSLVQKRFAIRMREEGVFSDTTKSSDSSTQILAVQPPDVSKSSLQQVVAASHIEADILSH